MSKKGHVVKSREYSRNSRFNEILLAVMYILIGAITAICGQGMLNIIVEAVGILFIVVGIISFSLVKKIESSLLFLILGIVFLILGLYGLAADIIRIVFGAMIVLSGIVILLGTQLSFMGYELPTKSGTLVSMALGAALIVVGIIAAVNWGGSFDIFIRIIGVIVLAIGVIDLMKAAGVKF